MKTIKFKLYLDGEFKGWEVHWVVAPAYGYEICHHFPDEPERGYPITDGAKYIRHDEKRQYTGKKDRNETEIYNKDFVQVRKRIKIRSGGSVKVNYTDRVRWVGYAWVVGDGKRTRERLSYLKSKQLEVVPVGSGKESCGGVG